MIMIGFSKKTSLFWTNLLCKQYKHCVVIFPASDEYILMQIATDGIHCIPLNDSGLYKLKSAGWVFLKTHKHSNKKPICFISCVGFVKSVLGINKPFIWRPDDLFMYIKKSPNFRGFF